MEGALDIVSDYPQFSFEVGDFHVWMPPQKTILYNPAGLNDNLSRFSLLHEISHGLLGHRFYTFDAELLAMEQSAWQQALLLTGNYNIQPDHDHIAICLASYENWLEQRATCPNCSAFGLQRARNRFSCIECAANWK